MEMQAAVQPETDHHYIFAVLVGGDRAMLDELPHTLHLRVLVVLFHQSIKLCAFSIRKLHRANSLSPF